MTTLYVRAPEAFLDGSKCGQPADFWAVGVIALSLLTGECPFLCERKEDVFSAQVLQAIIICSPSRLVPSRCLRNNQI